MSVPRATIWLLSLGVLALGCAHAPAAGPPRRAPSIPPDPAQIAALTGTWIHAGGEGDQALVEAAIDQAVAEMGLTAGFAAQALRPRVEPRASYTIRFNGDQVSIASPDHPPEAGSLDGSPVTLTDRFGDQSQTVFFVEAGALVESGSSPDGSGRTVFAPTEDGEAMKVRRVIESRRLSAPVDVTLTYRRQH
jgi:hypothetical protein